MSKGPLVQGKVGTTVPIHDAKRIAGDVYSAFEDADNDVLTAEELDTHLTADYPKILAILGHMHNNNLINCRATGNGFVWWLKPKATSRVTQR